jgi:hypothetical protein
MKGSETDAILTPVTEISSNKKKEVCDMEIADASSISQEDPTAEIDITKIVHSMKRGKRSTHQRVKISATWAHPFGFLNSSRVRGAHRSSQGGAGSKRMKRTRRGTRSRRVNTMAAKGKMNIAGGEGDSSNHSIPADEAATSDSSRVESAQPLRADSMASCVEFAVKLLKDEIPLPAEASEVEALLKQIFLRQKSEIPGPSQSSLSRKI